MINPLNELSAVYLTHIAEQHSEPVHSYSSGDNNPGDVKTTVVQIVKAVRYKAQKEGGNMTKAFNNYMSGHGGGIGAAETQMVKQKLGLQEEGEVVNEDAEQKKRELVRKHSQAALGDVKSYKKFSQVSKNYVKKIQAEKQRKEEGKRGRWDERVPTKEENEVVDEYIDTVKKVKKAELDQDIERWKKNVNEGNCKCSGCAPDGVGHQNPCVECGGHHKDKLDEVRITRLDDKKKKEEKAKKVN